MRPAPPLLSREEQHTQQNDGLNRSHEVAHALLHPLGDPHGTPEREVEAESTAFVVCHALGLDTGAASFPYVASWARGDNALDMVAASGERIAKTARRLLDALVPDAGTAAHVSADAEAA